ncbi:hypothetical protein [Nonomuraea dietziae]|uniref:hypothetical protein n=1 Tax=Nonomuraea dietziae TaxID=65515 RepID=UPI0033C11856
MQVVGESANPTEPGIIAKSSDAPALAAHSQTNHGILGETHADPSTGKAAVFGSHRADGMGVLGESDAGIGVFGNSKDGQGVMGRSQTSHGVVGDTRSDPSRGHAGVLGAHLANGMGVIGESGGGAGVVGTTKSGTGVIGESKTGQGIGVLGRGGRVAGRFEGMVEITGALAVEGSNVLIRIAALERELARLKSAGSTPGTPGDGADFKTQIDVELKLVPGPFSELRIFGSGFAANETVELTVESASSLGSGFGGGSTGQTTADASGKINHSMGVSCPSGQTTTHRVHARGIASGRISNSAAASC